MVPLNQIINLSDDLARYLKACGKSSVLQTKPINSNQLKGLKFATKLNSDIIEFSRVKSKIKHLSDEEYNLIMNKNRSIDWIVYSLKGNKFLPILENNKKYYPNVPHKMEGIIPYVGHENGFYKQINEYLSGRQLSGKYHISSKDLDDFINCCEYSLKHVDKEFGVYNGYVFRVGAFSGSGEQFYSTSKSPALNDFFRRNVQLNVIKVKNGHKIYKFQDKYHIKPNDFEDEKEILLSIGTKYKEVPINEEFLVAANKLAKKYQERYPEQKIEEIISKIRFWDVI